ncbi:MAG TPA: hypothetical protein VFQ39_01295 [Longimicrobium sp.]|nr:hypothetical protein [Longimicrobium sp.]
MLVVGAVGLWSCSGSGKISSTESPADAGVTATETPDAGPDAGADAGPPPTAPTITSFTASPSDVMDGLGQKATLAWQQEGATTVSISPDVGNVPTGPGSVEVTPVKTTTYTLTATNDHGTTSKDVTVTMHPAKVGNWTYYGAGMGLSLDTQDVSADEGGNVYVAGGDAIYAKARTDEAFLRFDASNAGLTQNCNDQDQYTNQTPPKPFYMCRIISVAGAASGKAILGFDMFDVQEFDGHTWAEWPMSAGGADVVAFDAGAKTLTRVRHVRVNSPPHTICAWTSPPPGFYGRVLQCDDPTPPNYWWVDGRRVFGRIVRIVVNHDKTSPLYGDVWFGALHGTFSALLANAEARGLMDRTAGMGPEWVDAKDVWEHEHPVMSGPLPGQSFVNGEGWALSIAPDGTPWGSNEYRTTYIGGYPDLTILNNPGSPTQNSDFWMGLAPNYLDLWPDPMVPDPTDPTGKTLTMDYLSAQADHVRSMSHCPDGTLWIGSLTHGLARIPPGGGSPSYVSLPDASLQNSVSAVACDPSDGSVWIGLFQAGGIMRYRNGQFERVDTTGAPAFATHPPQSIQIDRWSNPRIVYFSFMPYQASGAITVGGGVAAYAGP